MSLLKLNLAKENSELEFLYNTRKDPRVDEMLSGNPPQSFEKHLEYIYKVQDKTRWIYIAYFEKNMVGYSQVYDVTEKTVEIGFVIHPDFQGKGFGKEIVLETIEKAKENFPDKKVILYVLKSNPKAIHIYKKLGFIEKELPLSNETTLGMELNK